MHGLVAPVTTEFEAPEGRGDIAADIEGENGRPYGAQRTLFRVAQRGPEVEALHPRQWTDVDFAYWEGYVTAGGATPGESGRGYLEMVGYPLLR